MHSNLRLIRSNISPIRSKPGKFHSEPDATSSNFRLIRSNLRAMRSKPDLIHSNLRLRRSKRGKFHSEPGVRRSKLIFFRSTGIEIPFADGLIFWETENTYI